MSFVLHAAASAAATSPLDAGWWLGGLGVAGIFIVLFAETGLLVGFFLPGDSLLFTAGALCAAGPDGPARLALPWVVLSALGGAVCGAQTGYLIGRRAGTMLRRTSRLPQLSAAVRRGGGLLARFGVGPTLVLARFIPVVRTAINPLAGSVAVPVRGFVVWQVIGAAIWTAGTCVVGYLSARLVPGITAYVLPAVAAFTAISLLAALVQLWRARRRGLKSGSRR